MNQARRRTIGSAWLAAAAVLLSLAPAAAARLVDRVVAVVNGEVILWSEVDALAAASIAEIPAALPPDQAATRQGEIRRQALDTLIDSLLVRQQIREAKITVSDEEVDAEIKRVMELNKLSEQQLVEALKLHEGKTLVQFKEDRRKDMEQQKLIDLQIRSNPELKGRLQVGEKDVEEAYRSQYQSVTSTEKVRARHILFTLAAGISAEEEAKVRARAEEVLKQLRAGGAFEELAKQHSEDPSGALGGDLGFFRRGDMVGEFDTQAFSLKKGEISDLVRTPYGFHIIQVTDRVTEGPRPLAEVANEIRGRLQRERFMRVLQDWVADLRTKATLAIKL
jgi:peptidyl-prolyl cis-trans isomerase SurA